MIYCGLLFIVLGALMYAHREKGKRTAEGYFGFGLFTLGVATCIYSGYLEQQNTATLNTYEEVEILKTVAHIDLSNRSDLALIGVDKENDVAVYKYVKPDYNIQQGDTVYLVGGATAVVVSSDAVGFTVSSGDITAGMSGTAITVESGMQIGCISSRLPDGTYRCIWS